MENAGRYNRSRIAKAFGAIETPAVLASPRAIVPASPDSKTWWQAIQPTC